MLAFVQAKMLSKPGMLKRILQIGLAFIVCLSLLVGFKNAREAGATVSEHYTEQAKQYARQQGQGVFSFHHIFNSTRFFHHKSTTSNSTASKTSSGSSASSKASSSSSDSDASKQQNGPTSMWSKENGKGAILSQARRISPQDLMSRPIPIDRSRAPRLLHQSWKTDELPAKFQRWSSSCRKKNPGWEYVLWTDQDNRDIIKKYAPWFMETFKNLQSEIYRVDAMRNVYMHVFGGVYADLDTECLRGYDSMFEHYNVSTAAYDDLQHTEPRNATDPPRTRKAFLGRMGTDDSSVHSIPNAWMASTPGHPFWLLAAERIRDHSKDGGSPEQITGPISLRDGVGEYKDTYHNGEHLSLDAHHAKSDWAALYPPENLETLEILPFWAIYPFSWQRDGDAYKQHCLVGQSKFNADRCKQVIGTKAWGTWSITYWSHSWNQNGGENVDNLMSEAQKAKKKLKEEKEQRAKEREKKLQEKEKEAEEKHIDISEYKKQSSKHVKPGSEALEEAKLEEAKDRAAVQAAWNEELAEDNDSAEVDDDDDELPFTRGHRAKTHQRKKGHDLEDDFDADSYQKAERLKDEEIEKKRKEEEEEREKKAKEAKEKDMAEPAIIPPVVPLDSPKADTNFNPADEPALPPADEHGVIPPLSPNSPNMDAKVPPPVIPPATGSDTSPGPATLPLDETKDKTVPDEEHRTHESVKDLHEHQDVLPSPDEKLQEAGSSPEQMGPGGGPGLSEAQTIDPDIPDSTDMDEEDEDEMQDEGAEEEAALRANEGKKPSTGDSETQLINDEGERADADEKDKTSSLEESSDLVDEGQGEGADDIAADLAEMPVDGSSPIDQQ